MYINLHSKPANSNLESRSRFGLAIVQETIDQKCKNNYNCNNLSIVIPLLNTRRVQINQLGCSAMSRAIFINSNRRKLEGIRSELKLDQARCSSEKQLLPREFMVSTFLTPVTANVVSHLRARAVCSFARETNTLARDGIQMESSQ